MEKMQSLSEISTLMENILESPYIIVDKKSQEILSGKYWKANDGKDHITKEQIKSLTNSLTKKDEKILIDMADSSYLVRRIFLPGNQFNVFVFDRLDQQNLYETVFYNNVESQCIASNGYIQEANQKFVEEFGYSVEELRQIPYFKLVHPEDRLQTQQFVESVYTNKTNYAEFTNRCFTKAGKMIHLQWHIHHLKRMSFFIAKNVSEEYTLKQQLEKERAHQKTLIDTCDNLMLSVDRDLNILACNKAYKDFIKDFGGTEPQPGLNLKDLFHYTPNEQEDKDGNWFSYFETAFKGESIKVDDLHLKIKGVDVFHSVKFNPIMGPNNEVQGVGVTSIDHTVSRKIRQELNGSSLDLQEIIHNTDELIVSVDENVRVTSFNEAYANSFKQMTGKTLKVGDDLQELPPDLRVLWEQNSAIMAEKKKIRTERSFRVNGETHYMEATNNAIFDQGVYKGFSVVIRDITQIKHFQTELEEALSKLRFYKNSLDAVSIVLKTDRAGLIKEVNNHFIDVSGYQKEDVLGKPFTIFKTNFHPDHFWKGLYETVSLGHIWRGQIYCRSKTDEYFWLDTFVIPFRNRGATYDEYISISYNITENKNYERKLFRAYKDKDALLQELHHRVKNNLQLINSLFYIYQDRITQKNATNFLEDMQRRVKSMAMVHEYFLHSGDIQEVSVKGYLENLVNELTNSLSSPDKQIEVRVDIEEYAMDLEPLMILGLLLNELLTNAFKYAFEGKSDGVIQVELKKVVDKEKALVVKDDGVGFKQEDVGDDQKGIMLVKMFSAQLNGKFKYIPMENGTNAQILFKI